jgi:hypothetical protein
MLTPRTTQVSALSAHRRVPLGGWPVPYVRPVGSGFPLSASRVSSRPPEAVLTPPTDRR